MKGSGDHVGLFGKKTEKRSKPRTMMICPHCGGTDLYFEAGLITGYKYHCKHCEYVGAFVIEKDVDDFIEDMEKKEELENDEEKENGKEEKGQD